MRALFFCLYLGSSLLVYAQTFYESGVVLDSLKVPGRVDETFALYLPSAFDSEKLSPIIFIFEPAARGSVGIQSFISTSEKRGHILVCSNNARNGPYAYNFKVANALFGHILSIFSIKADEMYVSGFSGSARLATAMATLTEQFAGVVACGAGFSHVPDHVPSIQKYAYAGLCGDRDMNYREMLKNKEYLDLIKFNHTLITYNDIHRWPSPEQIERAFDWLYLQRLKKMLPKPEKKVLAQFDVDDAIAASLLKSPNRLFAAEQLERMLNDYEGWLPLQTIKNQHQTLIQSPEYRNQQKALHKVLEIEPKWKEKLTGQMESDFEKPGRFNPKWWEKEMAKLERLALNGDEATKKTVYRVKFALFVRAYSRNNALLHKVNEEQRALIDRFSRMLYPKSEQAFKK